MLRSCDCRGKRNKPTAVLQSRAAASCGLMSRKARATKRQVGFVRVASTSSAHTAGFPRRRMLGCFSVSPPSFLPLSAPFAAPTNAVIVTPATLKADVVPTTGVVLAPNLAGVRFILLLFLLVLQCQCVEHTHLLSFFSPSRLDFTSSLTRRRAPSPSSPKRSPTLPAASTRRPRPAMVRSHSAPPRTSKRLPRGRAHGIQHGSRFISVELKESFYDAAPKEHVAFPIVPVFLP